MGQQIANGHLALGRGMVAIGTVHFEVLEGRNKTRDGIFQLKTPVFVEHHQSDAGDRL